MQRQPEKAKFGVGPSPGDVNPPSGQRGPLGATGESTGSDVEATCRRIADYLLDLARDGGAEPALGSLIDALDRGMRELEIDARIRAQRIHDRLQEKRIAARDQRAGGQGCDPYFWG